MSYREEQDFAGLIIDSLKFAANDGLAAGRLNVSCLPRLLDILLEPLGCFECRLSGFRGEGELSGKLGLHLEVTGRVALRCQRCLGKVDFDCAIDNRLLLIPEGEVWPEDELESDDYDAIPADRELSVAELVEEEILLALPLVARHEECALPVAATTSGRADEVECAASPFAVLAGLKKH